MKALRREELIDIIKHTFPYGRIVFEDDLQKMMKEYGEDWFINRETNKWEKLD